MKTARLIKRNQLSEPFDTEVGRQTGSQIVVNDVRKTALRWIRERHEPRQVNPRGQFAALFRNSA
jgi:hypothetical protein